MTDSRFHVYFWRLLIFRWTLYKADISIKRTLLSCTNGVHFIETPMWILKRYVQFKQIEGKRVSSSQKKRTWGKGGCWKTNKGKQGRRGGVKTRESWENVLFKCPITKYLSNIAHRPRSILLKLKQALRENCPYSEFFWFLFSRIQYLSILSPKVGKYGPENLRIGTLFT